MSDKPVDEETLRMLRHDIKNQLSNIHLSLENLRFEISSPNEDTTFCLDTISASAVKINELLKLIE